MGVGAAAMASVACTQWNQLIDGKAAPAAQNLPAPPQKAASEPAATPPPTAPSAAAPSEPAQPAPAPTPAPLLQVGSQGEAVLALEKRLAELRYDVGAVDGRYDRQTWQGVVAFQKYAKLKRTGTYTPETQEALRKATLPQGQHPKLGLPRIEIDIPRQVLLYFDEKGLERVLAVSTGTNRKYCEQSKKSGKQVCGVAQTPRGQFRIQYRVSGWRESDLGKLYNPLYFNGGYAIHGAPSVPAHNASHGCVRISVASSQWFYATVKNGTPVVIFD